MGREGAHGGKHGRGWAVGSGDRDHWTSKECGFEELHPDLLGNEDSQ